MTFRFARLRLAYIDEDAGEAARMAIENQDSAQKYYEQLEELRPAAKLTGQRTNDVTRGILPNLAEITDDYADDLLMAIDDLFDVSNHKDDSWKRIRVQILLSFKIVHRLKELNQMDLVDSAIGTIQKHISQYLKLEKHFQLQIEIEILMLGRSLSTQESPIDCFISKIIEFTTKWEPHCEHIYQ